MIGDNPADAAKTLQGESGMTTDWRKTYHDLCKEIEILELLAKALEDRLRLAHKVCFTGYVNDQYSRIPLDRALKGYDDVKDELLNVVSTVENLKLTKQQIERKMGEFDGLEYKVAYMRDIERKPLYQIADELGFSYDWIREKSAKIKRMKPTKTPQTA